MDVYFKYLSTKIHLYYTLTISKIELSGSYF